MYYKHLNGFSRAPGNGKSCWSVGDTKISFLNTLAENGPYALDGFNEVQIFSNSSTETGFIKRDAEQSDLIYLLKDSGI